MSITSAHGNGVAGTIVFANSLLDFFDGGGNLIYLGHEEQPFGWHAQDAMQPSLTGTLEPSFR